MDLCPWDLLLILLPWAVTFSVRFGYNQRMFAWLAEGVFRTERLVSAGRREAILVWVGRSQLVFLV